MTRLHTVKTPVAGDPIVARDWRTQLEALRESVIRSRAMIYALDRRVGVPALMKVINLPNPGEITAQLVGDPALIPVNYVVTCDATLSELSRDGVTYVYTDFNNRIADGTETQKLTPSLLVDDEFVAIRVRDTWRAIDLGGRQWAKI